LEQVAAFPSLYSSTDAETKTDDGAPYKVVEDSVDSLLTGNREAVAAGKAATAALVAKPKVSSLKASPFGHLMVQNRRPLSKQHQKKKQGTRRSQQRHKEEGVRRRMG
jgi:hypothetical protein